MFRASVVLLVMLSPLAWGRHGPMDPIEKVRSSDLILVGTVAEVRDVEKPQDEAEDIAETARKVAVVSIETSLKGEYDGERVEIGFASLYDCDPTNFEAGESYLLFLRKTTRGFFVTTGWQWGALEVSEGRVMNPRFANTEDRVTLEEAIRAVRLQIETCPAPDCPICGGKGGVDVVPILYGLPTDEGFESAKRGECVLGGCVIGDAMWHCKSCGKEW